MYRTNNWKWTKNNFWYDHWMDDLLLIDKIIPNITHTIEECAKDSDSNTFSSQWNTNLLSMYLPEDIIDKS